MKNLLLTYFKIPGVWVWKAVWDKQAANRISGRTAVSPWAVKFAESSQAFSRGQDPV